MENSNDVQKTTNAGNEVLADVMPSNLKQINCRWEALQRMVKSGTINKNNIVNIQRIYPDDDIYFIYYWA